ncbi:CD44 antigen isoform X48 [Chrysemys picta bellii]|uniref:CD44 antigen isoform X48 n=1 Tax=Chrysemys picta bellii TaxID=8478 RepID=UPI0032B1A459
MKRGHELNGPWRLSCTLLLSAVVVSPDQNRSMLAEEFNISCRYAGVFHVEKNRRYSLTRDEAVELCKALNSTLPTMDQMENAHSLGFETCRYGFIEDKIVIPRIKPYSLCAANNTGIYILVSNITDRYDTYCYNASETREKACEPITRLDVSGHDNTSQIGNVLLIDNEDGSRYTDGVKHTDPTPVTDDNHVSSGSIHDGDATNPNIIGTRMPGTPYYEEITPDALSTDYSSGSGRKEDHPTSTNDIATPFDDKRGEDSTMISLITDGVPGKDHPSKGQHPTSTTIITADEDSLRGAHHENSTQSQQIPGFIPLQRYSTDHKEEHPTAVMKDIDSHEDGAAGEDSVQDLLKPGFFPAGDNYDDKEQQPPQTTYKDSHHGNSTQGQQMPGFIPSSADHKEEHPSTAGQADEDSQENITRGEDSRQSHLNRGSLPEGDNNEAKEGHPTSTSVKPVHEETSTQPQWNQFADSWWWWSHPDHKEQQPTQATGAVNPHHGAHEETSTQHEGNPSPDIWWGSTTDHKEQHRTTATKDKDSQEYETDDEDLLQDPLHSGWDTNDDMEQHPPVTSGKNEDPTQDPLLNGAHLGWSDKVKYSTNTTRDDVLPGVIPSRGSEHSSTAMVSSGGTKHEDSTQDPLLHTVHPGWGNADKYPTNVTRDDVLTGIIPPSEKDQEKESSHTAVTSNDGAIYEDSIHDSLPPDNQPGWGSEDKYPTNTSRDYVIPGLIPENEDESYTAVVSNDGATHEDSTQDPLLHSVHPGWGNEDKYLTAISRDDVLPGIIPPSETEHKNESSHTAVVSNDGIKHEDSTKDPLAPGIQPGGDNEDKYPTNNPIDNLIPGVFSDIEIGHGRGPASTATSSTLNKHDGRRANPSGQVTTPKTASQPRSAQIPEWLIIVASLLALTLILAVCIAVNSRSRCGQKKKLVINNGKGSVSDKKMGGLNGEASKSQEMVHLVNKQQPDNQTGPCDEFLTTDETKNQQEANMKTGL